MESSQAPSIRSLILWPVLITLAARAALGLSGISGYPEWLNGDFGPQSVVLLFLGLGWLPLFLGPHIAIALKPYCTSKAQFMRRVFLAMLAYGLAVRIPLTLVWLAKTWTSYKPDPHALFGSVAEMAWVAIFIELLFLGFLWAAVTGSLMGWMIGALAIAPKAQSTVSMTT